MGLEGSLKVDSSSISVTDIEREDDNVGVVGLGLEFYVEIVRGGRCKHK